MKKISIIAIAVLSLTIGFGACSSPKSKNVALKSDVDSLSYAIGVQQGDYLKHGAGITNIDEFVDGFMDALYPTKEPTKDYALGQRIGAGLYEGLKTAPVFPDDSITRFNKDAFVDGVIAMLKELKGGKMSRDEAKEFADAFYRRAEAKANAGNIEAEQMFLEENAQRDDIIVTESGLQYRIVTQGKGEIPGENTKVRVHYVGKLIDGTIFDSSVERGEPFETNTSGGIIPAWQEALKLMPVGSTWVIYSPSALAYGSRDMGVIPPYSPLVFEIELLEIVK